MFLIGIVTLVAVEDSWRKHGQNCGHSNSHFALTSIVQNSNDANTWYQGFIGEQLVHLQTVGENMDRIVENIDILHA